VVRKKLKSIDSLHCSASDDWTLFEKSFKVPQFATDSFSIVPVSRIEPNDENAKGEVFLDNIRLHADPNNERKKLLAGIESCIARQIEPNEHSIPEELASTLSFSMPASVGFLMHGERKLKYLFPWTMAMSQSPKQILLS